MRYGAGSFAREILCRFYVTRRFWRLIDLMPVNVPGARAPARANFFDHLSRSLTATLPVASDGRREARLADHGRRGSAHCRESHAPRAPTAFLKAKKAKTDIDCGLSSGVARRLRGARTGYAGPEHVICSHVRMALEMPYLLGYTRITQRGMRTGYHRGNETMPKTPQTISADLFGHVPDDPVPTRRSRTSNDPLSRISQSTAIGRRVADLLRSYLREMTDRTCHAVADASRAAELTVAAETARERLLAGQCNIDEVVKAERLARHAVRKLGLVEGQRAAKPKKTFAARERGPAPGAASAA
jgi:hypothetical protein